MITGSIISSNTTDKREFNMARGIRQCVAMFEWILNQRGIEISVGRLLLFLFKRTFSAPLSSRWLFA